MNIIRSLADLDSLVAEHAMGWVWQSNITHGYTILLPPDWRQMSNGDGTEHWIFCPTVGDMNLTMGWFEAEQTCFPRKCYSGPSFSSDPAASYALEQKMRAAGYAPSMVDYLSEGWRVSLAGTRSAKSPSWHTSRLIAMCLAALRALKVEFELQLDWDAKP